MLNTFNKTKIVATVGPASRSPEMLLALAREGVDVFRLNFSHGSHEEHLEVVRHIRAINEQYGFNLAILQDLQGPKIRIGEIENGEVELKKGQRFVITIEETTGNAERVSTTYQSLPEDVKEGEIILLDDGNIQLKVLERTEKEVITEVLYGGVLKSRKGINLPFSHLSTPCLTEKDTEDLYFGLEAGVDWIALSFVRTATDVHLLRHLIRQKGKNTRIIAKIEKPEAVKNIDSIIEAADGIMVARGDLGVETYAEEVPVVQKMIVDKCKRAAKPVIIATQMMESMIQNPRPTRAETNDVANAVIDGADAIMLSAETAVGKYPLEVIKSMVRTIHFTETHIKSIYHQNLEVANQQSPDFIHHSLVAAACTLAKHTNAKAIVGMTHSGFTAFRTASHRPEADIFIFTSNRQLLTALNLVWGVRAFYYDKYESTDTTFQDIEDILRERGFIREGDVIIKMASMPIKARKKTNTLKINIVEKPKP
ncbi:MAG: pyruvate kinase [Thermonema sp.]|uniref:pyruvate kinase n=1 Tax=Thermonema sp. TaxID=2231181 RepID=UPI0021DC2FF8|nr:pyruvate kinase [Thermonema sp.]GIV40081.1 MAG: pyruvate kinase [Thermonema sp.]